MTPRPRARSAARRLNTYLDAQTSWLDDNRVISLRSCLLTGTRPAPGAPAGETTLVLAPGMRSGRAGVHAATTNSRSG